MERPMFPIRALSGYAKFYYFIFLLPLVSFDAVPHKILISKLERDGFQGWTIQWIRNGLGSCSQRLYVQVKANDYWFPIISVPLSVEQWD